MLCFEDCHSFEGLWHLYEDHAPFIGILTFNCTNGGKLRIVMESKWFKKDIFEFKSIAGISTNGSCKLIYCFIEDSEQHDEIIILNIYVWICITDPEVLDENEIKYSTATLRLTSLYNYIASQKGIKDDLKRQPLTCKKCDSWILENAETNVAHVRYSDYNLKFRLQTSSLSLSLISESKKTFDCYIYIESSRPKSLFEYIDLSSKIRRIFSTFANMQMNTHSFRLGILSCDQASAYDVIFHEYFRKNEDLDVYSAPVQLTSRLDFENFLTAALELYNLCPQFYIGLEELRKGKGLYRNINDCVNLFDSAYEMFRNDLLNEFNKKPQIAENILRDELSKTKLCSKDVNYIVSRVASVSPSLKDKINFILQFSIKKYNLPHPSRYQEMINRAIKIRDKLSHGAFIKKGDFDINSIENIPDFFLAAIYLYYMYRIGVDSATIRQSAHRMLGKYMGAWHPVDEDPLKFF